MKRINILLVLVTLLAFTSCQKDRLVPEEVNTALEVSPDDTEVNFRGPNNWMAFFRGRNTDNIFFATSDDGNPFLERASLGLGEKTKKTPSTVLFNNTLFTFYTGEGTNDLWVASSTDEGDTWGNHFSPSGTGGGGISMDSGPSAVVFNGQIFIFYVEGNTLVHFQTSDGINYTGPTIVSRNDIPAGAIPNVDPLEPAPVVHNGRLYVFYSGNSNEIRAVNTDNGNFNSWRNVFRANATLGQDLGEDTGTGMSAISLGAAGSSRTIILAFTGINTRRVLEARMTTTGTAGELVSFTGTTIQVGNAETRYRPGIATDGSHIVVLNTDLTKAQWGNVKGHEVTYPDSNWSAICTGSSNGGCYAGQARSGVSVLHTGF